jgi:hypothetical protein
MTKEPIKEERIRKLKPENLKKLLRDDRFRYHTFANLSGLHPNTLSRIKRDYEDQIYIKENTLVLMREEVLDMIKFLRSLIHE